MESLGAAHSAQPFWRRLASVYRYAFSLPAMGVILLASLVSMAASSILLLVSTVLLTRYYFCCLENTARGELKAPGVIDCFGGGFTLFVRLILIYIVAAGAVGLIFTAFGLTAGVLASVSLTIALPAIFILLAIHGELLSALNPARILEFLRLTGLSYWLMLVFIFIMLGSVQLLGTLISNADPNAALVVQSGISSYYMITIFHMMGYVVFQNQEALGFYAVDKTAIKKVRTELQVQQAGIEVLVKEGLYERALELYRRLLPEAPDNLGLWTNCFRFLCATRNREALTRLARRFFPLVMEHQGDFAVAQTWRSLIAVVPDYAPDKADLRIRLARALHDVDDNKAVVRLLRSFHKQFDDSEQVSRAYELMASALERIPEQAAKAPQYRQFAARLSRQKPQPRGAEALPDHTPQPRAQAQQAMVPAEQFYRWAGQTAVGAGL
ncbi:MAG: hypothetical protein ACR2RB_21455 [Gammaproteobacteria bacterium]